MKICALASGSNGNAYYIEHQGEAILVDAGITRRQLLQRMKEKKLNINIVKAVFISHEHADHIRGFRVLCDMQQIPGYISRLTRENCRPEWLPQSLVCFNSGEVIKVGRFDIHCFAKNHDAADPCSFRIEADGISIGVMTDIGAACENVRYHLSQCHAVFLESNYDEQLLLTGPYPYYLKQRVASDRGHLSNLQSVGLVESVDSDLLHTILLSHISADNNRPELALNAFAHLNHRYHILPTNRYAPGEVLEIGTIAVGLINSKKSVCG